jgi:hypothetical protein
LLRRHVRLVEIPSLSTDATNPSFESMRELRVG